MLDCSLTCNRSDRSPGGCSLSGWEGFMFETVAVYTRVTDRCESSPPGLTTCRAAKGERDFPQEISDTKSTVSLQILFRNPSLFFFIVF